MCAIDPREASWTAGHTTNRIYSIWDSAKQIADVIAAATNEENLHPRAVEPGNYGGGGGAGGLSQLPGVPAGTCIPSQLHGIIDRHAMNAHC
jgi:hypothetical protein